MKLYFIYVKIPRDIYDFVFKFMLSDQYDFRAKHEYMVGLYAFTNSKKLMKEFFEMRGGTGIYTLIKKDYEEDEYLELKSNLSDLELRDVPFHMDEKKDIKMVVTKNEETVVKYDGAEYMNELGPLAYVEVPYDIFLDDIVKALDYLGYTDLYDIYQGDESAADNASYMNSFGLTTLGNQYNIMELMTNESNMLIYLFKYLFLGSDLKRTSEEL